MKHINDLVHNVTMIVTFIEDSLFGPQQTFHPDKVGLQCYSCGSLLNPNKKCDEFSRTDNSQVQTCLKDEACLMYSWKKSPTETGQMEKLIHFFTDSVFVGLHRIR